MAYNNTDEKVSVLIDIPKNSRGDTIRVSRIEKNDEVSYDIRNMYLTPDGTLGFTSKGIRVSAEIMRTILNTIQAEI